MIDRRGPNGVDHGVQRGPVRDVDDLELALDVLAGPAAQEAMGWRLELPPPRAQRLRDLKIAVWLDDPGLPVEADVLTVLESAVSAVREAGAAVTQKRPRVDLPDRRAVVVD